MTELEKEVGNRIRISIYAYAYEFLNTSLVSDAEYDSLSKEINTSIKTGNARLDKFFEEEFNPDTGMWVRYHPELSKLAYLCNKYYLSK